MTCPGRKRPDRSLFCWAGVVNLSRRRSRRGVRHNMTASRRELAAPPPRASMNYQTQCKTSFGFVGRTSFSPVAASMQSYDVDSLPRSLCNTVEGHCARVRAPNTGPTKNGGRPHLHDRRRLGLVRAALHEPELHAVPRVRALGPAVFARDPRVGANPERRRRDGRRRTPAGVFAGFGGPTCCAFRLQDRGSDPTRHRRVEQCRPQRIPAQHCRFRKFQELRLDPRQPPSAVLAHGGERRRGRRRAPSHGAAGSGGGPRGARAGTRLHQGRRPGPQPRRLQSRAER